MKKRFATIYEIVSEANLQNVALVLLLFKKLFEKPFSLGLGLGLVTVCSETIWQTHLEVDVLPE